MLSQSGSVYFVKLEKFKSKRRIETPRLRFVEILTVTSYEPVLVDMNAT